MKKYRSYHGVVSSGIVDNHSLSKQLTTYVKQQIKFGVIILGNTGVGKSFLCNIMVGSETFKDEYSPHSVTTKTESAEVPFGGFVPVVFNIPGLVEADQTRIDMNKKEIHKAFVQQPESIIIYVFGNQNGRIRDEDVIAFNAINEAYKFNLDSLLIVMNGLSPQRPENYEALVIFQLQKILNMNILSDNICFLDEINRQDASERQRLRERLLQIIVNKRPAVHIMKKEIEMLADELQKHKKMVRDKLRELEALELSKKREIEAIQQKLSKERSQHRTEIQSLELAKANAEAARWKAEVEAAKARAEKAETMAKQISNDSSCSIL